VVFISYPPQDILSYIRVKKWLHKNDDSYDPGGRGTVPIQESVLFIDSRWHRIEELKLAEGLLEQTRIHFAGTGPDAVDILTPIPDMPVFIVHNPPECSGFDMMKSLSRLFPECPMTILVEQELDAGQTYNCTDNALILPLPATPGELALMILHCIHIHRNGIHTSGKLEENADMLEATRAIMKSADHQFDVYAEGASQHAQSVNRNHNRS